MATGREKKRQAPPNVAPFQLKQIKRLLLHRNYPWPNDQQSRRYLQPLLDIGLTGHEAKRLAPWLSGDELEEMIMQTVVAPKWNARTLGDRFEVTLEEKLIPQLGLKTSNASTPSDGNTKKSLPNAAGRAMPSRSAATAAQPKRRTRP